MVKKLLDGDANWATNVVNRCRECGCKYALEPDDDFQVETWEKSSQRFVTSTCPTCGFVVTTGNPNFRG